MPRIVYGVLDVHPSHRIESPAPARQAAEDRPDACSQCHLDKTRAWAARERARLFGPELANSPPPPPGEVGRGFSEVERALFQGDPIQRALAASTYGRAQPFRSRADVGTSTASVARRLAFLLEVMENDPYPAIRHLAQRSARQLLAPSSELTSYVPETQHGQRRRALAALRARFALPSAAAGIIQTLRADASMRAIEIGE
jgi:hypothetical protein